MRRRQLIFQTMAATTGLCAESMAAPPPVVWRMPDEAEPHARTWMSFGANADIWGQQRLPEVQRNLATLAREIAQFEPVSMLVRAQDRALAQSLTLGANVSLHPADIDDLWIRDTGPSFVLRADPRAPAPKGGVQFNFNGWGNKQAHTNDARVAAFVADRAGVPLVRAALVMEGGCIEVDGQGTAIMTESCVLNDNRNPGLSRADVAAELLRTLGVRKIIWLPGIRGRDITDGHTDFYARFARPGLVLAGFDPDPQSYDHAVTKANLQALRAATDAQGKRLDVVVLQAPTDFFSPPGSESFAAGYVGFYVCNGAVIAQKFGDTEADEAAKAILQRAFPGRVVRQLRMDAIAWGGGSVHCATQQEPAVAVG